jgi:hypothetical protein
MSSKTPEFVIPASAAEPNATPPAAEPQPEHFATQWAEARLCYPLYAALGTQFNLEPLPYPSGQTPPVRPTRSEFDRILQWLDSIDAKVLAYQIRQVPPEVLNGNEKSLRALVRRHLRRPEKSETDRDKIDLLLVQYFALTASEELCRKEITLEDVATVLKPVLAEADPTPLEWCDPLDKILAQIARCHSLRDLLENGLLEQGRLLKEAAGCMFYDPAALVAFCRFNFLLRRAFIRMLHADLIAMRQAVGSLETHGVKSVDCRRAGLSAAETTVQLRHFCENWRQPFQKDYTQSSVNRAFEQLLALRTDLEEALAQTQLKESQSASTAGAQESDSALELLRAGSEALAKVPPASTMPEPAPASDSADNSPNDLVHESAPSHSTPVSVEAPEQSATPVAAVDAEKCLEAIWEQLIAATPSRGRSMATVVLQDTKFLLSSWEVAAFVAAGGQGAEDLRRAVVARALLALGIDERKRSGDQARLTSALVLARGEVSYFQGRVEQAKREKNTEAAVNLGISTKRLLSFMEEAEKVQP